MRYADREHARSARVPEGAVILSETRFQVVFTYDKSLYVLRLIEIRSSCTDCTVLWTAQLEFVMKLSDIIQKSLEGDT